MEDDDEPIETTDAVVASMPRGDGNAPTLAEQDRFRVKMSVSVEPRRVTDFYCSFDGWPHREEFEALVRFFEEQIRRIDDGEWDREKQ